MANNIDERLENTTGSGYDETWNAGEATGGGSTIDSDAAVSGVTGAPDNWEDDCLECVYVASNNCRVGDLNALINEEAIVWWRFEFIFSAESLANNEGVNIFSLFADDAVTARVYIYLLQDGSGNQVIRMYDWRDGTLNATVDTEDLDAGIPCVLEGLWDITNDDIYLIVDGRVVVEDLSGVTVTTPIDTVIWGGLAGAGVNAAATLYFDNLIVNNGALERVGTGRFIGGLQSLGDGVGTKTLNPAHALGGRLNGGLQAA